MVGKREMRSIVSKYLTAMVMVAALTFMVGCDDADINNEMGLRFRVAGFVTYDDNGVDDGRFDAYDSDALCEPDEAEAFFPLIVTVPFESDVDMLTDGYIDHIDVVVDPVGTGTNFLSDSYVVENISNARIPAEGGTLDVAINMVSPADKRRYGTDYGGSAAAPNEVDFRITMTTHVTYNPGDGSDVDYELPPITFGIYGTEMDNCE